MSALVPDTTSGFIPNSLSAWMAPQCAAPFAPPPLNAMPNSYFFDDISITFPTKSFYLFSITFTPFLEYADTQQYDQPYDFAYSLYQHDTFDILDLHNHNVHIET